MNKSIVLFLFILCGCSTHTAKPSRWDYMTPEHVTCHKEEVLFCRQYGPKMICECIH